MITLKKHFFNPLVVFLIILGIMSVFTPSLSQSASKDPESLVLVGRGTAGSTSDLVFTALEKAIAREFPKTMTRRLPGTAMDAPLRVNSNEAQIGHGVGVNAVEAWFGQGTFKTPQRNLRFMGNYLCPPISCKVAVLESSPIKTLSDLKNKRVGVGGANTSTSKQANLLFQGIGFSYEDIKKNGGMVVYANYNQQLDQMLDGQLDAVIGSVDDPSPIIIQITAQRNIRFIKVPEESIKYAMEKALGISKTTIKAGVYPWLKEDIPTISLTLGFLVNKNLPEDIVYRLMHAVYDEKNLEDVWFKTKDSWRGANVKSMAGESVFLPMHPGAEKYFKEMNIPLQFIGAGEALKK